MKAFGIFEGGGAKGLAHVGALMAAEDQGIEFIGVAGASAGAIVAALLAAGYRGDELFDVMNPSDKSKIYSTSPSDFFKNDWVAFDAFVKAAKDVFKKPSIMGFIGLWWGHKAIVDRFLSDMGIFSTEIFEAELDKLLRKKLTGGSGNKKPTFDEIPLPLKIVATDVTRRQLIVFSKAHSPSYPVSKAVAASINLPFVFKPQSIDLSRVKAPSPDWPHDLIDQTSGEIVWAVDGGLLSNFPAWLFDEERAWLGPHMPTFGFRLVEDIEKIKDDSRSESEVANFGRDLIATILSGDPLLETREIENLHEIPLRVSTSTLEFDMNDDRKVILFEEGYRAAEKFFNTPGSPCNPRRMRDGLKKALELFEQDANLKGKHLRINVVTPTTRNTLRVTYSYNMDNDTDDRLEFPVGSGASGLCWKKEAPIVCNLEEAKDTFSTKWSMSKYQQALVKQDLKALLCVPIFAPSMPDDKSRRRIIGILNIDSSDDILDTLTNFSVVKVAEGMAETIAGSMVSSLQGGTNESIT